MARWSPEDPPDGARHPCPGPAILAVGPLRASESAGPREQERPQVVEDRAIVAGGRQGRTDGSKRARQILSGRLGELEGKVGVRVESERGTQSRRNRRFLAQPRDRHQSVHETAPFRQRPQDTEMCR